MILLGRSCCMCTWFAPFVMCVAASWASSSSHEVYSTTQSSDLDTSVEHFNKWYYDASHKHSRVDVKAGVVGSRISRTSRIGLVAAASILLEDAYLEVNASLALSVRTLLFGRWPSPAGGVAVHQRLVALRRAVLEWVRDEHPELATHVGVLISEAVEQTIVDSIHRSDRPWKTFFLAGDDEAQATWGKHATQLASELPQDAKDVILAVWLMHEMSLVRRHSGGGGGVSDDDEQTQQQQGPQSFYEPYLSILPRDLSGITSAVFFDHPYCLAALEGTALVDRIFFYRRKVAATHERLRKTLFPRIRRPSLPRLSEEPVQDTPWFYRLDTFQWAMGVLWTRQVWWEQDAHLAPMHDLANCREPRATRSNVSTSQRKHKTSLLRSGDAALRRGDFVATRAMEAFSPGEEVFENYGESNSFYMLFHGFALSENSADCSVVLLPQDPEETREVLPATTRRALQHHGGMLRDAPCLALHPTVAVVGLRNGTAVNISSSLAAFLSTLAAGLTLTTSEQSERRALLENRMERLRKSTDFAASVAASSAPASQPWYTRMLWKKVLRTAHRWMSLQLKRMPQPEPTPPPTMVGAAQREESNCLNDEVWSMIQRYTAQQSRTLQASLRIVAALLAETKQTTDDSGDKDDASRKAHSEEL